MSDEDVVLGEEVRLRRKSQRTVLIAVRLPRSMIAELSDYEQAHGLTLSETVRLAIRNLLHPSFSIAQSTAQTEAWNRQP